MYAFSVKGTAQNTNTYNDDSTKCLAKIIAFPYVFHYSRFRFSKYWNVWVRSANPKPEVLLPLKNTPIFMSDCTEISSPLCGKKEFIGVLYLPQM